MRQHRFPLIVFAAAGLLAGCSRPPQPDPPKTYSMGEKVTAGHMVYTVFETKWETKLPQEPTPRIPRKRFFLVRVSAVNGGGTDVMLPDMSIEDDQGNSYPALHTGDGVPDWLGTLRKIAPAEAASGNVAFDAPPRHYKLRVTDENGEQAAYIDIPLSFNSETPTEPPVPSALKPRQ